MTWPPRVCPSRKTTSLWISPGGVSGSYDKDASCKQREEHLCLSASTVKASYNTYRNSQGKRIIVNNQQSPSWMYIQQVDSKVQTTDYMVKQEHQFRLYQKTFKRAQIWGGNEEIFAQMKPRSTWTRTLEEKSKEKERHWLSSQAYHSICQTWERQCCCMGTYGWQWNQVRSVC